MRRIVRETRDTVFERGRVRTMMIEVRDGIVSTWPKGLRAKYPVSLAGVWHRAIKTEVDEQRKTKAKRRKRHV